MNRDELVFEELRTAALQGERSPTNAELADKLRKAGFPKAAESGMSHVMRRLVRAGKIEIELYPRLWRKVYIVSGPHAGAATASPPGERSPLYRMVQSGRTLGN